MNWRTTVGGDKRARRGFLWWPTKFGDGQTYWLVWVVIEEEFVGYTHHHDFPHWKETRVYIPR